MRPREEKGLGQHHRVFQKQSQDEHPGPPALGTVLPTLSTGYTQAVPSCISMYLCAACFQDVTGACGNAGNAAMLRCHRSFHERFRSTLSPPRRAR